MSSYRQISAEVSGENLLYRKVYLSKVQNVYFSLLPNGLIDMPEDKMMMIEHSDGSDFKIIKLDSHVFHHNIVTNIIPILLKMGFQVYGNEDSNLEEVLFPQEKVGRQKKFNRYHFN